MARLKILFVEDISVDVELAVRELKTHPKIDFNYTTVDNEYDFRKAIDTFEPDIIISDYVMPSFDGMSALKITRELPSYIPFIILTGSMNEETAVACMKSGADDYVIKEKIKRLPFAVKEVIIRNSAIQEKKKMQKQLIDSEKKFSDIFYKHSVVKLIIDPVTSAIVEANNAAAEFYGWSVD